MKAKTKRKMLYYSSILSSAVICAAMLAVGCAVVRVNCHNAMNADKMVLISVDRGDEETVVTVMGRAYVLPFGG